MRFPNSPIHRSPLDTLHEELEAFLSKKCRDRNSEKEIGFLEKLFAAAEHSLSAHEALLQEVFENSPYISVIVDSAGHIQDINRAGVRFADQPKEQLLNLLGGEVFGCITSFDGAGCGLNEDCTLCPIRTRVTHTFQTREPVFSAEGQMTFVRDEDVLDRDILVSTTLIEVSGEDMVLVTLVDITAQKRAEEQLAVVNAQLQKRIEENEALQRELWQQSVQDPLTSLYNRRFLYEAFPRELARAMRAKEPIALIMIDLDHFKTINDTFGHPAGDHVLQCFGEMIIDTVRVGDIPCRFGGEEFLLLLPGVSPQKALDRAEEIRARVESHDFRWAGEKLPLTLSAGVASIPEHGKTLATVVSNADNALYKAKASGRNTVVGCHQLRKQGPSTAPARVNRQST